MVIFILLFWLDAQGTIQSTEVVGTTDNADTCRQINVLEAVKHADDAEAMYAKSYVAHVGCGIPVPDTKPDVGSSPGHPDGIQGPSGNL